MFKLRGNMKKAMAIILGILLITSISYGAKTISYDRLENPQVVIFFNVKKNINGVNKYIPIYIQMGGTAISSDGLTGRNVRVEREVGGQLDAPKTNKEIYNMLPNPVNQIFKDMFLEAISEDVSQ